MKKVWLWLLLCVLAAVVCIPMYFLIDGSLMGKGEVTEYLAPVMQNKNGFASFRLLPMYPTLRSYVELLLDSPEFFVMFWNSVKLTLLILAGQLVTGVPAAWGFARLRIPGKRMLFQLYVILMLMPFQVTMLSNYLTLDRLRLLDTHAAIILPAVFSTFPVFLMYRFFENIPESILESARVDGAGSWTIFRKIGVPLGSAGIVSAMVLGFLEYWNLIEQPLVFLKDKSLWPLSLYLPNIGLEEAGMAFVASVVTLIPSLLVFFAGGEYLEQGIAASAVKE
ncbi:carbohydrate ABC transporter permease [Lachnospiraceae bacterium ASD3451]|uniref:carbohydrate ABC transporter permease n=1 Tax=Diplocloster agilis TaxID=2850323 RepID=UPI001DDE803F|nr:carbohydrate ABC transporter permease [Diplocloster agilis]MBU9744772.1 carbohydrate ABC transporter permease [Diplocloster agilis]